MQIDIKHNTKKCNGKLSITGSKSETNRLLLLQRLISGFEFKNPNEIARCGCGESFTVA